MCIYCKTKRYRKIYEGHYGPIPKDNNGRSFDVHHIDGNRNNNTPNNLIALSITDHFDLHKKQGDWAACLLFAERLKLTAEERSILASKSNIDRVNNKSHPFLGGEIQRTTNATRIENKTHNFLTDNPVTNTNKKRLLNGTHHFIGDSNPSVQKVRNGTHHFIGGNAVVNQIANGKHTSQIKSTCPHCQKTVSVNMFGRWHGDKCKLKH